MRPPEALHQCFIFARLGDGVGEVGLPFVVTARVGGDEGGVDVDFGLLPRALEVQQGASAGIGIVHGEQRAVPARALVVVHVGVYGVEGVEAVGQGDVRPQGHAFGLASLHGAHHFPDAAHVLPDELPARGEAAALSAGGDGKRLRRGQQQGGEGEE